MSMIECVITDLETLRKDCTRLGLTFHENKKSFTWYYSESEKCDHCISIPGAKYQIGVVKDGAGNFQMKADFWEFGGLRETVGQFGEKLIQAYGAEKTILEARKAGYTAIENTMDDGTIRIKIAVNG